MKKKEHGKRAEARLCGLPNLVCPVCYNPPSMIAQLKGVLVQKAANRLVIEVHGVGYEVFIPFSTYYELGDVGDTVSLQIYTHVREDTLSLYGFLTGREQKLFVQLIQISGIGPRLSVTILSGLPVEDFIQAVVDGDLVKLTGIPGVGKKTAERIVLEMKDKIALLFPEVEKAATEGMPGSLPADVVSALVNLGYPRSLAEKAVSQAGKGSDSDRFEDLLKKSLKKISG